MQTVCQRCGKINQTAAKSGFCNMCEPVERQDYHTVKDYVRLHPKAKVIEVHKQSGVSLKVIDRMVKNGGLILVDAEKETD